MQVNMNTVKKKTHYFKEENVMDFFFLFHPLLT